MRWISKFAVALVTFVAAGTVQAADGCKFLLCIAGPWTVIPECRATVLQVFRDTALGRPFPTCDMSGEGSQAQNALNTESTCPEMYRQYNDYSGAYMGCAYNWKIDVYIDGYGLWETVYWDTFGTSTWYSDSARAQLNAEDLDPKYDNDLAAWEAAHPEPPPCDWGCDVGG
jgi:hypothetical protein